TKACQFPPPQIRRTTPRGIRYNAGGEALTPKRLERLQRILVQPAQCEDGREEGPAQSPIKATCSLEVEPEDTRKPLTHGHEPKMLGFPVLQRSRRDGLKARGIHRLIVIGLIAHTCVEATVRFAAELRYQVTVVKDATASYSAEHMHAVLDVTIPNSPRAVVGTEDIVASLSAL